MRLTSTRGECVFSYSVSLSHTLQLTLTRIFTTNEQSHRKGGRGVQRCPFSFFLFVAKGKAIRRKKTKRASSIRIGATYKIIGPFFSFLFLSFSLTSTPPSFSYFLFVSTTTITATTSTAPRFYLHLSVTTTACSHNIRFFSPSLFSLSSLQPKS